jgi:sugar phosphate isomerase/epimerase
MSIKEHVDERIVEILASFWTFAGTAIPHTGPEYSSFDFRDRVEAIGRVGFKGMGIWHADLAHTLETYSLADMKRILDDNGVRYVELEFLTDWFVDGERRQASDEERARLLAAAEALNARHIKIGDFVGEKVAMDRLIDEFAILCRDAADHGTRILFELLPVSMINTLEDTLTMLEGADADNGGLILDTWHVVKIGVPYEEIPKIPRRFLLGVELNDGETVTPEGMDFRTQTTEHRKFCGEGDFDLDGFLKAVKQSGYDGPYGIEVLSLANRILPLDEVVKRAYETTRAQLTMSL